MAAREAYSLYVERAAIGRQRSRWALIIALGLGNAAEAVEADPLSRLSAVARGVHERLLLTPIDLDHRAVDEVGERGGEVRDEVRDLLDLGDAPERDAVGRELVRLLVVRASCRGPSP